MKQTKLRAKPELKIADNFLDLRTQETSVIVQHLEEQIRLRELPLEKHLANRVGDEPEGAKLPRVIQKTLRKQSSRNE
jgi:hypothetical protein